MRTFILSVLVGALVGVQGRGQATDKAQSGKGENVFATEWYVAKGGLGVILDQGLFIDLKSPKNELILGDGRRWTGKAAGTREFVVFFEERIWSPPAIPSEFDLSKAVVISFEDGIVRFFRFDRMLGGYYQRIPTK